jgi:hypothetical protein
MDESPSPSGRPRRARVALLLAGTVVLLGAAVGTGVTHGRGGKGGDAPGPGGVAGAASTVAGAVSTVAAAGAATGSGDESGSGRESGSGGQAGSGGGGAGGDTTRTTYRTTTTTTATTTGATTTTEAPLAFIDPPSGGATASCTPSKFGGYDFTAHFRVSILFSGGGTLHYQWGRGRDDVRADPEEHTIGQVKNTQFEDSITGRRPSGSDVVTDNFHILDPPNLATTVTVTHSICLG